MEKTRFIIIGSGWRSLYYVRIAKALPDVFELCAMYCRTEEKAEKMASENNIHTTTSIEECIGCRPDLVVVAVSKSQIAEVSMEWLNRGFTVLCETPAALETDVLKKLWSLEKAGRKLVVAEQYTHYPSYQALIDAAEKGLIGDRSCLNISLAHEYHGASLMRRLLGIDISEGFSVSAKEYSFPTAETLTRYDAFKDGRVKDKKRTVATFEFESGKAAFYDFDSEQYRSPIRRNYLRLQGVRGEIVDDKVYYLDKDNEAVSSEIRTKSRLVERPYDNVNLRMIEEIEEITFEGERVYSPKFGLSGLSEDETAIAELMEGTKKYGHGEAPSPYPLYDALQDAYMAILLQKAVATGETLTSEKMDWQPF